jgi:hypothetical protein
VISCICVVPGFGHEHEWISEVTAMHRIGVLGDCDRSVRLGEGSWISLTGEECGGEGEHARTTPEKRQQQHRSSSCPGEGNAVLACPELAPVTACS